MLNEIWVTVFTLIKSIVGDVDVKNKGTLQKQIDDCFQSASNGKKAIASAITGKGISTAADATFEAMAANIGNIKTSPNLQAKNAALGTSAQTIKPDTGYDGLSQVSIPAVSGNADTGDVLSGKTFNSGTAGIARAGTMADKTGTADHSATASLDSTNGRLKLQVPAAGKYGTGNYLYAAFSTVATLTGLTAAKLVKGNTVLGIAGNANNMDTSGADAAAADILSGKKACVKGSLITGGMANKGAWTGATTGSDNVAIPAGYHNGSGYVSGAGAYNKGVTDADARANTSSANYKAGYNAGVSATKVGTAGTGDVLSGKTFTNASSVGASGSMANKGGTTVDAGSVTRDDSYTYFSVSANGYYNTSSKVRALNSNIGKLPDTMTIKFILANGTGKKVEFSNPGYKYAHVVSTSSSTLGTYKVAGVTCARTTDKEISIEGIETIVWQGTGDVSYDTSASEVWARPTITLHN